MTATELSGWLFASNADAAATMRRMTSRVRACLRSREVIELANEIVASAEPYSKRDQIRAIYDWLARRFRFVSDPVGVELLRDPAEGIRDAYKRGYTQGDCDEAAMIAAAVGLANGIPARFRALAFGPTAPYTHVIADLHGGGSWIAVDVTRPQGFAAPRPSRTLTVGV